MSVLVRGFLLRRLTATPGRTLLTVLGVALGVAVLVGIRLASGSAMASFAETVDAVSGRATLQVRSRTSGFDERWYVHVRGTPGVEAAAPVVEVQALAATDPAAFRGPDHPGAGAGIVESLLLLGVDPLAEAPFARGVESGDLEPGREPARAWLRLLAEPATVAVTHALARRLGVAAGDTLFVLASGAPVALVVVHMLGAPSLQHAAGGGIALVDVATAQEVFGLAGRLDRIDLVVPPARVAAVTAALSAALPGDVVVERPAARTRQVDDMVRAFRLNLTALSFISLFVSTFLVFNAVALSVLRARREIGVLRALGVTRRGIAALFVGEGVAIGAAGSALGLVLGAWLAGGMLGAVGGTLETLYLVAHTRDVRLDPGTLALGFGLGVGSAAASALAPALEAAATPAGTTMRQGMWLESRAPASLRLAGGACVALVAGALAAWASLSWRWAAGGFVSAGLVIAGFTLLAPGATLAAQAAAEPLARRSRRIELVLGVRALRAAHLRAAAVVAALTVAVGMLVALQVMVGSFRRTVDTWITQTLRGDLYVEPVGHRVGLDATALPPGLVARARALPGVRAVDTYRATPMLLAGRRVQAVGIEFDVQRRHGGLTFLSREPAGEVLGRARSRGEVVVTESFAHHLGIERGDSLDLPAPRGVVRVRVAGVFHDYTTDAGAVLMDRERFAAWWGDDRTESLALYAEPGADLDAVRAGVLAAAGPSRRLIVTPNQELRRRVLHIFDQTFRITGVLQGIAVLVAVLGVVTTLTALILQRGREIAVLRASGARRAQVRAMVLVESAMLGLAGSVLGCAAGIVLALLLVHVINRQYFGWSIRFALDPAVLVQAVALIVSSAVLAGNLPAWRAANAEPGEGMRLE